MTDLELREKVATLVMGREHFHTTNENVVLGHVGGTMVRCPAYEYDHNAAFEVVEKMERDGWECSIEIAKSMAFVAFRRVGGQAWEYIEKEEGLTAPEAICRAALAAMEANQ